MANGPADTRGDFRRWVMVPAAITLAVTILRLVGELEHWPKTFFNHAPGGGGALVGISWLPIVFGPYFAAKLVGEGRRPASTVRAVLLALVGNFVAYAATIVQLRLGAKFSFESRLLYGWTVFVVGALVTLGAWPALFKVLLVYAYAARIPVAVIMFFAFQGNWGTHYDAAPPDFPSSMTLLPKYIWLGFVPQLTFWVAFTLMVGMLFGTLTAGVMRLVRRASDSAGPASRAT